MKRRTGLLLEQRPELVRPRTANLRGDFTPPRIVRAGEIGFGRGALEHDILHARFFELGGLLGGFGDKESMRRRFGLFGFFGQDRPGLGAELVPTI